MPPTAAIPPAKLSPEEASALLPNIDGSSQLVIRAPSPDTSNGEIQAYAVLVYKLCNGQASTGAFSRSSIENGSFFVLN